MCDFVEIFNYWQALKSPTQIRLMISIFTLYFSKARKIAALKLFYEWNFG